MKENDYISDILSGLGLAINEKNNNQSFSGITDSYTN